MGPSCDYDLGDVFERLTCVATTAERWRAIVSFMAAHGADQINYAVLDLTSGSRASAGVIQFSSMDPTWIAHYLDQQLYLNDPHVEYAKAGNMAPYVFHESMATSLGDVRQTEVIRQAAEAGLRSQISMLAPDSWRTHEPVGGMSIGSSRPAADFYRSVRGRETVLIAAAMLFHTLAIGDVRRHAAGALPLTSRERDCLTYLALGLRTARIADRLSISEATVELHLRNARVKLGASTSAQAVARGMTFGEIAI